MRPIHVADAFAPAMMLSYGIGRIGCHVAGDGDWGIVNNYPKPFSWLPDWVWAYTYPNNVLGEGIQIPGCAGQYCAVCLSRCFQHHFMKLLLPFYFLPFYGAFGKK